MDELEALLAAAPREVSAVQSVTELDELENRLTGRKSALANLRRGLSKLDESERPAAGARLNSAAGELSALFGSRRLILERQAEDELLADDAVDITLPGFGFRTGTHHLITQTIDELVDIFVAMGYQVAAGP